MPAKKTLTKSQLADKLGHDAELSKKEAGAFLNALTDHIHGTLKKGGEVKITDIGRFAVVHRKARVGRNPQTGEPIKIPAKKAAKVYLAKTLREIGKK